jgi:uncharacterized protein (DUF305 family)
MKYHNNSIIAAVLALLVLVTAACSPQELPQTSTEGNAFDRQFIEMMVPHHESALEMAKIAQERGEHPEIKQMADDIINVQAAEIDQMLNWLEAWYGTRETPPMDQMPMLTGMEGMAHGAHTMDMAADVEALRSAPEPFDLAFIDYMILHHESALDAANAAIQEAGRSEITTMAEAILAVQQEEIDQMKAWRAAWYPDQP